MITSKTRTTKHTSYFYIVTNEINDLIYYGSGCKKGYKGSGAELMRDMDLFGAELFHLKELLWFETRQEAYDFEDRFLKLYKISKRPNTYNDKDAAQGFGVGNQLTKGLVSTKHNGMVTKEEFDSGNYVGVMKGHKHTTEFAEVKRQQIIEQYESGIRVNPLKDSVATTDGIVSKEDFDNGNYTANSKGLVSTTKGQVTQEEFDKGGYVGATKGNWTYQKRLVIEGETNNVKTFCEQFGVERHKDLKDYLETNNIEYTIVKKRNRNGIRKI